MSKTLLIVCLLLLSVFSSNAQHRTKDTRPNIVLIVSDDHGREVVGCYGNKAVETPNIDRLASEGTRFSNAFATVASCSPSRAVILSGMQSHANGMYGLEHQQHHFSSFDTIKSLPALLEKAGYRTGRIGKFHVAPQSVYHFQKILQEGGVNNPASIGRSPVEMADICNGFINEKSDQPFFLYFAADDPHRSNSVLPNGVPFFDGTKPNAFGNKTEGYPKITRTVFKPGEVIVPPYLPDIKATREELAEYYQAISRLDQGIGKLIENLKKAGKYENTVILYITDNGAPFPGSKTTLYEPGIKLPCIVKIPKPAKTNFVQDAMISWVDLTPTLLDFANALPTSKTFQGRSFKNIIENEKVEGWDEVYGSHNLHEIMMYYPMRMVRERRFKLIYNIAHELKFPQALDLYQSYTWQSAIKANIKSVGKKFLRIYEHHPKFELYDLQNDPNELFNLAANPKYKNELERLIAKLKVWQKNTNDMWISKWEFE